jgi:NADPH:quinone reductase-like Zn-dependent oxidoreductase
MVGAHVIGTGSTKHNQGLLTELGADQFINYQEASDSQTVIQDFDLDLDCVGSEALEQGLKVVKKEGLVIGINAFNCKDIAQQHGVRGTFLIVSMNIEQLTKITNLIEKGVVPLVVDSAVAFEQSAKAFDKPALGHNHVMW